VTAAGWQLGNADLTVICQAPKLAPHIGAMRQRIADLLGCSAAQISVKATTTEKLGFTGRKEGIVVQAVVLLVATAGPR
jgi:2-C-methyl-D-erythritol 2,4-cyclodiphosphate synthase